MNTMEQMLRKPWNIPRSWEHVSWNWFLHLEPQVSCLLWNKNPTAGQSCFLEWSKWLEGALPQVRLNSPRSAQSLHPTTGFLMGEVVFPIFFLTKGFLNATFAPNQKQAGTKDSTNMENLVPGWHRTERALETSRISFSSRPYFKPAHFQSLQTPHWRYSHTHFLLCKPQELHRVKLWAPFQQVQTLWQCRSPAPAGLKHCPQLHTQHNQKLHSGEF